MKPLYFRSRQFPHRSVRLTSTPALLLHFLYLGQFLIQKIRVRCVRRLGHRG